MRKRILIINENVDEAEKLKNGLCLPTMMLNALPTFLMPSTDL